MRYTDFTDIRPYTLGWSWDLDLADPKVVNLKNSYAPVALFDKAYDDLGIDPIMNRNYPQLDEGAVVKRTLVLYNDEFVDTHVTVKIEIRSGGKTYATGTRAFNLPLGEHMDIPYSFQVPHVGGSLLEVILITRKKGSKRFEEVKKFNVREKGTSGTSSSEVTIGGPEPGSFPVILEAEEMPTKTTGASIDGGWNIWADGYIESTVRFPESGDYEFRIEAHGSQAAGGWPVMELRIDQDAVATFDVNSKNWSSFISTKQIASGSRRVAVAFINDYYKPPEDRNLYVDKIVIARASASSPGDVDGNGSVEIQDLQACVNHILGVQDWGAKADVSGDGIVNILDCQIVINIILQ
jgi:hypothetical protein